MNSMIKKARDAWKTIFTQGLTPQGVSLCVASGITLGLFPVPGTTTILCAGASRLLRINAPITQAVNWIAAPLQLILIIPFMKFGALLLGMDGSLLSDAAAARISGEGIVTVLGEFGTLLLAGSLTWLIVSIPMFLTAYGLVRGGIRVTRGAAPAVNRFRSGLRNL